MSWDFETDPEFQAELDWVDEFVRTEVEPVDQVIHHAWDMERSGAPGADPTAAGAGPRARACGRPTSARTSADPGTAR